MFWPTRSIPPRFRSAIEVAAVRARRTGDRSSLAANVDSRRVWFESRDARLHPAAEAFGSAFLVPSLRAGRLLAIDPSVCAEWFANLRPLTDRFRELWYPDAPGVAALPHDDASPPAPGTALCFSGGVDSFHTLLGEGRSIDTLVYAIGYDVRLGDVRRAAMVEHSLRLVAAETGGSAIVIRTNLRRHPLVRETPWLHGFGGAIASLGHLLRDRVGRLLISSDGLGFVSPEVGSRPNTDPLFGSATMRIAHVEASTRRLEKIRRIATEPLAQRHLRVCWVNARRDLNCGACEKCVRTMLALESCDSLGRFRLFPKRVGLAAAVDALPPPEPVVLDFYRELLACGLPRGSAAAVRRLLDRAPAERPAARTVHRPIRHRLLPLAAFTQVFEPLVGRKVGYVRPLGNVGDELIELAMGQLFAEFGVTWATWQPGSSGSFDVLVFGGGGNMGDRYRDNHAVRSAALSTGIPLTILPQSFTSAEDRPFARVYVRERESLRLCPRGVLAPDLALGLAWPAAPAATRDLGLFLRRDQERRGWKPLFSRDPARICRTPADYLALAAEHRRIVTDRLHFAIAGLHAGRQVTLVANDYHKNRSMHATWLAGLGCRFADSVAQALGGTDRRSARVA